MPLRYARTLKHTYLPRRLTPQSLAGTALGYVLGGACVLVLVVLAISDLLTPPNVTVSAIGVFAVLAAAWFLSARMTIAVLLAGVLLQILLVAVGSLDAVRAQFHVEGVYWLTAVADIAAFLLTAAIGRFAAGLALDYGRVRDELQRLALVEDRNRISQELHDGVIQSLFAIGLELESSAAGLDAEHREAVNQSLTAIKAVIRDLRGFIYGLLPSVLDEHGLRDALLKLAADFSSKANIEATTTIDPELAEILAPQGVQLVLFVTEALSNLAQHSGAASFSMTLARAGDDAVMEIRDDGTGFDPAHATGKGLGLHNLGERAAHLNGRLEILSAPGQGTTVRLVIPLPRTPTRKPTGTAAVERAAG